MKVFQIVLLSIFQLYKGVNGDCCRYKIVGSEAYHFKHIGDTSLYNCIDNCIYEKESEEGSSYCFAAGDLRVKCEENIEDQKAIKGAH